MTTIAEDIKTFVIASTAINSKIGTGTAARCHYNALPQSSIREHIWFRVSGDTVERTLDKVGGLHEAYVDLECAAALESESQALADSVQGRLDGYAGAMGNSTVQGCFLSDKDDSYEPRIKRTSGVHVATFDMHLWYTT